MASNQSSRRDEGLALLAAGQTPKQVAAQLHVAVPTVYSWRARDRAPVRGPALWDFRSATRLLTAEGPKVFQKLLSLAKAGDMRAIALVVKLLGGVTPDQQLEHFYLERNWEDLGRVLRRYPKEFGAELMGVLAEASARTDEAFATTPLPAHLRPR